MARPSDYSIETADAICEQMVLGKGLLAICSMANMPSRPTVYRWLESNSEFRDKYARAREALMDFYAEQILVVAFDESGDVVLDQVGDKTTAVANHAKVQRDRLKVDAMKWTAAKLFPRRYGDKLTPEGEEDHRKQMQISWEQPNKIERIIIQGVRPESAEDELRKRIQELEEQLGLRERTEPPRMLTFDPGPLPKGLDQIVLARLLQVIKNSVPRADQRDPQEVIEEVLQVCETALRGKYATEQAA